MLVKSVICIILCLSIKSIYSDENDKNIEAENNHYDSKILKNKDYETRPSLFQKLLLLPYKPFKKPIKGNTKPIITSVASKPSPAALENKKEQANITLAIIPSIPLNEMNTTVTLPLNNIEGTTTQVSEEINSPTNTIEATKPIISSNASEPRPTSLANKIENVSLNENNTTVTLPLNIETTTTHVPKEINIQTVVIEASSSIIVLEDNTETTTLLDKGISEDLSTDIKPSTFLDIEKQTQIISTVDDVTSELPTSMNMDQNIDNNEEFSKLCIRKYEYHLIKGECDTFIECKKRVAFIIKCPEGLLFNPKVLWPNYPCSYPTEVKCEGKTQPPDATNDCDHQYGFFPSKNNCSQYIMCQEGKAYPLNCPAGLVFNTETNSCDWPANVPTCQSTVLDNYNCPESSSNTGADLKYRYGNSCREYVLCLEGHPRLLSCDLGFAFDDKQGFCINSEYVQNCI